MRNVLILGGNGFLGLGLQRAFSAKSNVKTIARDTKDYDLTLPQDCNAPLLEDLKDADTVILLAAETANPFDFAEAAKMALANKKMNMTVINALIEATRIYKKQYSVVFYSDATVFGNVTKPVHIGSYDTAKLFYAIDYLDWRSCIPLEKIETEQALESVFYAPDSPLKNLLVVYPFNVTGFGQRQGVLYGMLMDAISKGEVCYSDSTRMLTDIDVASKIAVDEILSTDEKLLWTERICLCDTTCTVSMKELAKLVQKQFSKEIKLINCLQLSLVQHRYFVEPDQDLASAEKLVARWSESISYDIYHQL